MNSRTNEHNRKMWLIFLLIAIPVTYVLVKTILSFITGEPILASDDWNRLPVILISCSVGVYISYRMNRPKSREELDTPPRWFYPQNMMDTGLLVILFMLIVAMMIPFTLGIPFLFIPVVAGLYLSLSVPDDFHDENERLWKKRLETARIFFFVSIILNAIPMMIFVMIAVTTSDDRFLSIFSLENSTSFGIASRLGLLFTFFTPTTLFFYSIWKIYRIDLMRSRIPQPENMS